MSLFNRNSPFEALVQRENQRRAQEANLEAVEALELGLAFADEADEIIPVVEEESFIESPQFEEALRAFAEIDQKNAE